MPTDTTSLVAIAALLVALLAMLLVLWLLLRTRRLAQLSTFRPKMPADMQSALEHEAQRIDALTTGLQDVANRLPKVERQASAAVQRVGIVRFNPFADTGGQQSFAIAMLDERGTGFVVSSLHSRQATRLYMKQITEGKTDVELSGEEAQALKQAGITGPTAG